MDGWTDNRTRSMTTHFLKALHQQKPEPTEPPAGTPPVEAPQYLGTYVLHKPKHRVTSCTTIEAPKCPRQEGQETRLSLFWTITPLSSCRDQKR
eukprot:scaffold2019_cov128-Amphora_coffeaeformis.AAC.2